MSLHGHAMTLNLTSDLPIQENPLTLLRFNPYIDIGKIFLVNRYFFHESKVDPKRS